MHIDSNPSGTPYDFENPESYIPPVEFRSLEATHKQDKEVTKRIIIGSVGRLLLIGAVFGSAAFIVHTENNYLETAEQQDTPAEQSQNCIEVSDELFEERITKDEAIEYYVKTREESTSEEYINYDLLDKTKNKEEISGFLNDYYVEQDVRFHFGELPLSMSTPTQTNSAQAVHKPDQLSLYEYQLAAFTLTDALSKLPPGILDYIRGTDIYVTSSVALSDFEIGGLYSVDNIKGRPFIILNSNDINSIKSNVYHEIGHALHDKMCIDEGKDIEYVRINSGANYTREEDKVNFDYFISEYAATNSSEDVAEMTESLFLRGTVACYEMPQPICDKEELLLKRLGAIDSNILKYIVGKGAMNYQNDSIGYDYFSQ